MNRPKMNGNCSLDVQFSTSVDTLPDEAAITRWVELVVCELPQSVSLCVRLVDEEESQDLNNRYRMRDAPTNVLSFPCDNHDEQDVHILGDIIVCAPIVLIEAREQGKIALDHWAHLVIHGVLHLLGYDHQTSDDAERMEQLEIKLLQKLSVDNPYAEA